MDTLTLPSAPLTLMPPLAANDTTPPLLASSAPLDMPTQDVTTGKMSSVTPTTSPDDIAFRRTFIFGTTFGLGAIGTWILADALSWHGWQPLEVAFLVLFAFLFTWMAFAFMSFAVGLWVLTQDKDDLGLKPDTVIPLLHQRTAILLPICNEDAHGVAHRLDIIRQSLQATAQGHAFDIFVLSDTQDAATADIERGVFQAFERVRSADGLHIYYRRRTVNTDRKAGNIADWVRNHGADYAHVVTLDADSIMSGATLVRLAGAMERHPGIGLIQTAPRLINQTSLFARCEQFAARLYGPAAARGIAWWSGAEGNYWGHNAILRTRAFAESAGLPHLPGRAPFGGHIMSHDFVEAALMRRAGWAVHMAPCLDGSYEESPPTLMDTMDRDRRWCQGNIQHAALLNTPGLHWINRFHLLRGVLNYLIAPIWVAMVAVGAGLATSRATIDDNDGVALAATLAVTLSFLIVPKVFACAAMLHDERQAAGFGGTWRTAIGVSVETAMSTLLTPIVMISHTFMVISTLSGRKSGWKSQRRSGYAVSARELADRFTPHTVIGAGLMAVLACLAPEALVGMSGATLSLIMSGPLAALTAQTTPDALRGLFRIPEEHVTAADPAKTLEASKGLETGKISAKPAYRLPVISLP